VSPQRQSLPPKIRDFGPPNARIKLRGQGPRAEADAARRLLAGADVSIQRAAKRRAINVAGGVPPANLVC